MLAPGDPPGRAPDLIFLNADVLTLSPHLPRAEAVAVRGERISAVGSTRDVGALVGKATRVIECGGKCLLPGFHDAHVHLLSCASSAFGVGCTPMAVASIREIRETITRRAEKLPPGQWIRAGGYDEWFLAERRHPTRYDLDAAAPDHPVKLVHRSRHACVFNSVALRLTHLDDPRQGQDYRVDRDSRTGEATGLIYDLDTQIGKDVIPPVAETELRVAAQSVGTDFLCKGVTSVQDATATNGPAEWRLFEEMTSHGAFGPRITLMVGQQHISEMLHVARERQNPWLRAGHVKIMLAETESGFNPDVDDLFEQVWAAHRLGLSVAIHAVEESEVVLATEAIAAALERLPRENHRHRLEHASVAPPALLDRIAELEIGVATQPCFVYYSGDRYLAEVEAHQQPWLYPLRSMLERGIIVAAGSDAPVAPADPLLGLYAATTRSSRGGQAVNGEQTIAVEQALRALIAAPATLAGVEGQLGSIEPGKLADLVLLDANPLTVPPEEIPGIAVDMTIVGGRIAWQR